MNAMNPTPAGVISSPDPKKQDAIQVVSRPQQVAVANAQLV